MFTSFVQRVRLLFRKLWLRVAAISLLGVVAVLAAKLIGPFLPPSLALWIGANSVDQLLDILSGSMLAVTTFSLSVMVSVHRSISAQWTPRAHRIQLRDRSTQMVLATFIGAFVYALSSIILRSTQFFEDRDIVVLFAMTLVVIVLVVVMIMRWLVRLQTMGSLADISDRICELTAKAFHDRMERPCLGATALTDAMVIPEGVTDIRANRSGYVERIFPAAIDARAKACDGHAYLIREVGDYIDKGDIIAHVTDDALVASVVANVQIGEMRDVEQDPGFGLTMLAEIASKALSPGVNDGGTAIDMIDRIAGILQGWQAPQASPGDPATYPRVFIRALNPDHLIRRPLGLIARDGAGVYEVQAVLQERLFALARHPDPVLAAVAEELRGQALTRALETIPHEIDRQALADHAASLTQTGAPMSGTAM
ncbi:DUF2254 domain-containing protein [Marimonas lutisalis]|uniref:DUF2254 domain-containing protein n=1 Tax=Marimonas lutisalis TaxID=2545756 RepID=UPI0010F68BEC|nr:DUF2254 domain-containing protein [Marimonas lutisalis]